MNSPSATSDETATGTGVLTVSVTDADGRPLVNARVSVLHRTNSQRLGSEVTGTNGLTTFRGLGATVLVRVSHWFGKSYENRNVEVAQSGDSFLSVVLSPIRPQPTAALLPVSIPPDSVSADRSELTLEIAVVASASAPFWHENHAVVAIPVLAFAVENRNDVSARTCTVRTDVTPVPYCEPYFDHRYSASVLQFGHDPTGTIPLLAEPTAAASVMLVMDQSQRVAELDSTARRSFAARRFIERALSLSPPQSVSIAGIAGVSDQAATELARHPLWSPLAPGSVFSTDEAVLDSTVQLLEPFVGGPPAVLPGIGAALALTAAEAPPGSRALIAFLGHGDDDALSESARRTALAALRQQRDAAGIQTVVILGAPYSQREERWALAELAAALRAPTVSLGLTQPYDQPQPSWAYGSYAALDLAADLISGFPLPSLSGTFRVKASAAGAFPSGGTLRGAAYLTSDVCPFGCWEFPLEFAVEIP